MKCSICGNKSLKLEKFKNGRICSECLSKLPEFVLHDLKSFEKEDINKFILFFEYKNEEFSKIWFHLGCLSLTTKYILLNRSLSEEYPLYSKVSLDLLEDVYLEFLPRAKKDKFYCYGDVCICFHFRYKNLKFRQKICNVEMRYEIENGEFKAIYSDIFNQLKLILNRGVSSKTFEYVKDYYKEFTYSNFYNSNSDYNNYNSNHSDYEKEYEYDYDEEYEEYRDYEEYYNESSGEKSKTYHKDYKEKYDYYDNYQKQSNDNGYKKSASSNTKQDELSMALDMFNLSIPFDTKELKKSYRKLISRCHPDQKERDFSLKPEEVNHYYTYLKKFVS